MSRKLLGYVVFFVLLLAGFFFFALKDEDFSRSPLAVINADVEPFSFTNQNGEKITEKEVEGKVYVAAYFFTSCKGICPRMNANMRLVFDAYKNEPGFMILSHTCMPETDSVPLLKAYEAKMVNGVLVKNGDGSCKIEYEPAGAQKKQAVNLNWNFVTGNKAELYKMARQCYMIDNNKPDSLQNISDQFIHTQFFALVDKRRRVRGIYDGLKSNEIEKLIDDIKGLLKEKTENRRSMTGFGNEPN